MNAIASATATMRHCPTPQAIPTQAASQVQAASLACLTLTGMPYSEKITNEITHGFAPALGISVVQEMKVSALHGETFIPR